MKLTESEYNKTFNADKIAMKKSKYNNKTVLYDGIVFDSIKEYSYYQYYKMLEKNGYIKELKYQVPFILQESYEFKGKTIRPIKYIADFTFVDNEGLKHIIDIKGSKKVMTDVFKIKKKLFEYKYNLEIEIIE